MSTKAEKTEEVSEKGVCGIVMPISGIDGCDESHWQDVLKIISESITEADFMPNLVSNADEVGAIHKRIIQNLYENPIIVCDVSGKNPNVMFELGMRLAFDKPTIIIKDDQTSYSFDTSSIEHLEYPRDLRFNTIIDFKKRLSAKIKATYYKSTTDKDYTTFLKHFGSFTVAKLDKKEISGQEFILEELKAFRAILSSPRFSSPGIGYPRSNYAKKYSDQRVLICFGKATEEAIDSALDEITSLFPQATCDRRPLTKNGHTHVVINSNSNDPKVNEKINFIASRISKAVEDPD